VITVGMVSAGLISFYQSLAIMLGADIGTTLTVQLVVWKVTDISPLFIAAGGFLWFAAKGRWRKIGEAVFYFGMIFFGLNLMGAATAPLKHHQGTIEFFREMRNPLLGAAVGALFTGIVHASVIPISMLVILGQQGLITIDGAMPIVFGANIGTTVTALMAAAISNISGKRCAASHLIFKCAGVLVCLAFMPAFITALKAFSVSTAQQIVIGHFLLNIVIVCIFFLILKPFAGLVERIIPGREDVLPLWPEFLHKEDIRDPDKALHNTHKEIEREMIMAKRMFDEYLGMKGEFSEGARRNILYMEMMINYLSREIREYLWQASCAEFSRDMSRRLFTYTAMVDDVERIGNHIVRLIDSARDKKKSNVVFSAEGRKEIEEIEKSVADNLADAFDLIVSGDRSLLKKISLREGEIDAMIRKARENHLVRFHRRICHAQAGPIFIDMLIHMERISDHCQNISEHVEDIDNGSTQKEV